MSDVCKLLVASNGHGLNEELVAASGIGGGFLFHRLEENCGRQHGRRRVEGSRIGFFTRDLDIVSWLNATRVWADTISN